MSVSSTQITIRLFAGWVFLLLGLLQAVPRTQSFHVSSSSTRNSIHAFLILSSPTAKNIGGRTIDQNDNQLLPLFMAEENDVADSSEPPVIPVKCPDCDKCDGSGRYATKMYNNKQHQPEIRKTNYSSRKRKTDRTVRFFVAVVVFWWSIESLCHVKNNKQNHNFPSIFLFNLTGPSYLSFSTIYHCLLKIVEIIRDNATFN